MALNDKKHAISLRDRARVTIDCLYKFVYGLSIGDQIDDFKHKQTAVASRGLPATARHSCIVMI